MVETEEKNLSSPAGEAATQQLPSGEPKKRKTWLWVLLGCVGCLVCIISIVLVLFIFGGWGVVSVYNSFKDQISKTNQLCKVTSDSELWSVYEEYMTDEYQRRVPYSEFKRMWEKNEEIFKKCDVFTPDLMELLTYKASWEVTREDKTIKIKIVRTVDNKKLTAEIVIEEEDGTVKINDLKVSNL